MFERQIHCFINECVGRGTFQGFEIYFQINSMLLRNETFICSLTPLGGIQHVHAWDNRPSFIKVSEIRMVCIALKHLVGLNLSFVSCFPV